MRERRRPGWSGEHRYSRPGVSDTGTVAPAGTLGGTGDTQTGVFVRYQNGAAGTIDRHRGRRVVTL